MSPNSNTAELHMPAYGHTPYNKGQRLQRFRPDANAAPVVLDIWRSHNRRMRASTLLNLVAIAVLMGCTGVRTHSPEQRTVVIGDIHADIGAARSAFQLAGATNERDEWIGGDLVVVQLGDIIGRSYEDRGALDFILEVRQKAEEGGGRVYTLIGNHEVFGARLELRWVADEAYAAFSDIPNLDLGNARLAELPEYQRARGAALMPGGYYARKLAEFPSVLRLGQTIYVHGGVTPHWAKYGIDRINEEVSQWFAGHVDEPISAQGMDPGNYDDSVMMSRHFSEDVDENDCAMLEESLKLLDATRMIVAHSVHDSITARCEDKVWAVDVGMSRYYGGEVQVLEVIDDEILQIIEF